MYEMMALVTTKGVTRGQRSLLADCWPQRKQITASQWHSQQAEQPEAKVEHHWQGQQAEHSHRFCFPRYLHNTGTPATSPQALSRSGLHIERALVCQQNEVAVTHGAFDAWWHPQEMTSTLSCIQTELSEEQGVSPVEWYAPWNLACRGPLGCST